MRIISFLEFGWSVPHNVIVPQQPEEKKKKKERDRDFEIEPEVEEFHPNVKVEIEQSGDRPVRACRTQQGKNVCTVQPWISF